MSSVEWKFSDYAWRWFLTLLLFTIIFWILFAITKKYLFSFILMIALAGAIISFVAWLVALIWSE